MQGETELKEGVFGGDEIIPERAPLSEAEYAALLADTNRPVCCLGCQVETLQCYCEFNPTEAKWFLLAIQGEHEHGCPVVDWIGTEAYSYDLGAR